MSVMQWSYSLVMRAKNQAATVLATYFAGTLSNGMVGTVMTIPTRIGPPTYEAVVLDREGVDYSLDPLVVGFRPRLVVEWTQRAPGVLGLPAGRITSGGWSWGVAGVDLAPLLSLVSTVGNVLEISLDGGTTWRSVNLASHSVDYKPVDAKTVAVALSLEFSGRKLVASVPDLAPASWGSAV